MLVLTSAGEFLQVNQRGKYFYKTLRNIMKRRYRRTHHLQYRNQSIESKNRVIYKLHQAIPEQWSMQHARLAMEKA